MAARDTHTTVPPFGLKDKVGYMFGDIANNLTFATASTFLMIFYTEVLLISPGVVGTLFAVSRVIDALTDVIMGNIVDRTPATKDGKFRPWLKRGAIFVAFAAFLMYQSYMVNTPMFVRIIYMFVTYILWGSIAYTMINIPYGSMAAAMSSDPDERTQLSVWRGAASPIANMVLSIVMPMFIYETNSAGQEVVRGGWVFPTVAGILSVIAVILYFINFKWSHERVDVAAASTQKPATLKETFRSMGKVIADRSLLSLMAASVMLLLVMVSMNQLITYLFPFYYHNSFGVTVTLFIQPLISVALIFPLASVLARRHGKKEIGSIGMLIGAAAYLGLFLLRPENIYVYIVVATVAYIGMSMFNAVVWAMITDVVDDHEVKTGERTDGVIYGINSFSRKVGQSLAGGAAGWGLGWIGYNPDLTAQSPEVLNSMYNMTTMIPVIGFTIGALILIFWSPLNKKRTDENARILREKHNA